MFSIMSLPTGLIRMLVVAALLGVSLVVVLPRHRRAGLVMAAGALFDLIVSISIPLLEMAGVGLMLSQLSPSTGNSPGSDPGFYAMVFLMLLPLVTPLAQAVNLGCITAAVAMLALRLPVEEREQW